MKTFRTLSIVTTAVLLCASPVSLHWSPVKALSLSVDRASARVGRLTPLSVAGVHRRAYRRGAYGGGYYGGGYYGGGATVAAAGAVAAGAVAAGAYAAYPASASPPAFVNEAVQLNLA